MFLAHGMAGGDKDLVFGFPDLHPVSGVRFFRFQCRKLDTAAGDHRVSGHILRLSLIRNCLLDDGLRRLPHFKRGLRLHGGGRFLRDLDPRGKHLRVAVMGCVVYGPGEAKEADFGIAGGDGCCVFFKKGEKQEKLSEDEALLRLVEETRRAVGT